MKIDRYKTTKSIECIQLDYINGIYKKLQNEQYFERNTLVTETLHIELNKHGTLNGWYIINVPTFIKTNDMLQRDVNIWVVINQVLTNIIRQKAYQLPSLFRTNDVLKKSIKLIYNNYNTKQTEFAWENIFIYMSLKPKNLDIFIYISVYIKFLCMNISKYI